MSFFVRDHRAPQCRMRGHVDHHFAANITSNEEVALRAHLVTCDACRGYYDRMLLLARLDPGAKSAEARLAQGLGIRSRRPLVLWAPLMVMAGAAAVIALFVFARPKPPEFASRGSDSKVERAGEETELLVYRVDRGHAAAPLENKLSPNDELAFGYRNPAGKKRIMVFAVDEHGHVYWYHPAWRRAEENPTAVAIEPGAAPHELPESIGHALDGNTLRIYGVFTDEVLSVRAVEARVAAQGEPRFAGSIITRMIVKVER